MTCPYDLRPCERPRCARCPHPLAMLLTDDLIILGTTALFLPWAYDCRSFPGFTPAQVRAGLTTPATEGQSCNHVSETAKANYLNEAGLDRAI